MYLLKATFVFTLFFAVYKVLFSRLTFHTTNRFLLLFFIPFSLGLPLSNYILPSSFQIVEEIPFMEYVFIDSNIKPLEPISIIEDASVNYWEIAGNIYFFIVFLFIVRSILTIRKLYLLKKNSQNYYKEGTQIIETDTTEVFSFFQWIFIPMGASKELNPIIISHEKTHAKLKHSFDVLIAEIYTAFFWFNPLVFQFKKSIKSVHEFQVDDKLLQKEVRPIEYLQLLLESLSSKKQETLYNYFSHPILKKRVDMMTKIKSHRSQKFAYFVLIPIGVFLTMAFGKQPYKAIEIPQQQETSFVFPIQNGSSKDITSHFGVKRKILKKKQQRIHQGIDIRANEGASVLAASEGIVVKASLEGNWGNLVVIQHTDGYETLYAHLKNFKVAKNQKVKQGEIIGYAGKTGQATGPHLHYELRHQGKNINPLSNIKE